MRSLVHTWINLKQAKTDMEDMCLELTADMKNEKISCFSKITILFVRKPRDNVFMHCLCQIMLEEVLAFQIAFVTTVLTYMDMMTMIHIEDMSMNGSQMMAHIEV